jgi:ankyrin repeat protein
MATMTSNKREREDTGVSGPEAKRPRPLDDAAERADTFRRVLTCLANVGYGKEVCRAARTSSALYWDPEIWQVLVSLPKDSEGALNSVCRHGSSKRLDFFLDKLKLKPTVKAMYQVASDTSKQNSWKLEVLRSKGCPAGGKDTPRAEHPLWAAVNTSHSEPLFLHLLRAGAVPPSYEKGSNLLLEVLKKGWASAPIRMMAKMTAAEIVQAGDEMTADGKWSLTFAIEKNLSEAALKLISSGVRVCFDKADPLCTRNAEEPLHLAAKANLLPVVEALVHRGAPVDGTWSTKNAHQRGFAVTPLALAVKAGHVAVCRFLFHKGADLTIDQFGGRDPVSLSIIHIKGEVFRMFLDCGVDLRGVGANGSNGVRARHPVHWAALTNWSDLIREILYRFPQEVNSVGIGNTPWQDACMAGNLDAFHELLRHFKLDKDSETVSRAVRLLCGAQGPDYYRSDEKTRLERLKKTEQTRIRILRFLWDQKVPIDINSCVETATRYGLHELAKVSGDFVKPSKEAMLMCAEFGHLTHALLLQEKGGLLGAYSASVGKKEVPVLCMAARHNREEFIRKTVEKARSLGHRFSLDVQDFEGRTPLLTCIEKGFIDCAKTLLNLGANALVVDKNKRGPLHYLTQECVSCWPVRPEPLAMFARTLFEKGCDANYQDKSGKTPFETSDLLRLGTRFAPIIKEAISKGLKLEGARGARTLITAVSNGDSELVNGLITTAGVDPNVEFDGISRLLPFPTTKWWLYCQS